MLSDYKDDYLLRLQKSELYIELKKKCSEKDSEVVALVDNAVSYAVQRTKTIIRHMGEFTLHDGDHLFRVLHIMERLLTNAVIKQLSSPELMLLILIAFFHDIGMSPDETSIIAWRKVWDDNPFFANTDEEKSFEEFKRFYSARPEQQDIIERLVKDGKNSHSDTIKAYLITEFIRQTHAERAREIIEKDWNNKILYRDTDLTVEFAQLCYSHNEEALALLEFDRNMLCATNTFACLPLLGIVLRLADVLDFDAKRTPSILFSHLYVRNPVSIKEWNKHRAVEAWEISSELIQYSAKCNHPVIEASIHEFCKVIDQELSSCNNIANGLNDFNNSIGRDVSVRFPYKVNRDKIRTQRDIKNKPLYLYRNTQFTLSKRQVIDLLMGTKLYGNAEVALRELLQNSIDACLLRQAQEKKWNNPYLPEISVKYYTNDGDTILEVIDNGTGMDQDVIDKYYSKVGSSFYRSTDFYKLKSETNADFTPTSRFGIGILSCFMVADTLIVDTKRVYAPHKSSDALNITVEGQESIFLIRDGKREIPGTSTKLILREAKNPWDKMSEAAFIKSVMNTIPNPPFKISINTEQEKKHIDENSFKEITAISLKDYSWKENENIRWFEFNIDGGDIGIIGSAVVAILEKNKLPVKEIQLTSKEIEIEGKPFTLERSIWLSENSIKESSKSITISDDGQIHQHDGSSEFTRSKSRLSLHGIEVPTTLFPASWQMKNNQVKVSWPFPLLLVVDVCGIRDLDLNSPRTDVIMSDKWIDFEEDLAYLVCKKIRTLVDVDYWEALKEIYIEKNQNDSFIRALNRI